MQRSVDPVLALGAAALAGAYLALAPLPAATALVALAFLARDQLSRPLLVACVIASAATGWRANAELEDATRRYEVAREALGPPSRCHGVVEVVASPTVLSGGEDPERRARLEVELVEGACEERAWPAGLRARLYGGPDGAGRGDRLEIIGDLGALARFDNPGSADSRIGIALRGAVGSGMIHDAVPLTQGHGVRASVDAARAAVRARIEATFPTETAPLARALVLGENDLEEDDRNAFRDSGLSHLLAVSGTHLVMAVLAFGRGLRAVLARVGWLARRVDVGRISAAICAPAAWLYADFAGGSGSALRAAAMIAVAMAARGLGARPCAKRALGWSLVLGAAVEPLAGADISFLLSVGATAGLLASQGGGEVRVEGWRRFLAMVRGAALATVAATAACAPVLLLMSGGLPLYGVAANLLAAPIGELAALPLCLLHAVTWWAPSIEQGLAVCGAGALELVRTIAHASADAHFMLELPPPTSWQLTTLAIGVGASLFAPKRKRFALAMMVVVLVGLELHQRGQGAPQGRLRVTALDVGQGDSLLVDLPDGSLMLVDGGGLVGSPLDTGARVVLPALRARRRGHVDIAVLSHPHPDHYLGFLTVLAQVPVGELWISGLELTRDGQLRRAVEELEGRGTRVRLANELCGQPLAFAGAEARVLGPCPSFDEDEGANDNSLVIRIALGRRAVLLTGDAEEHEEAALLASGQELAADLLKVGHHGSRTSSTPAFLAAVRPSAALVSCGVRNRFGHPHGVTVDKLDAAQILTLRTDLEGAVLWETDGEGARWRRALDDGWHDVPGS
jgi:competence protein ComEC